MSDIAIRVENLGKQYRLGESVRYRTLRESLENSLSALWGRRAVANGSSNGHSGNGRSDEQTLWALKDVSFEVPRGTVLGIIGRNGAGKSTLLKILSRITEPTTGEVEIHGRVGSLLEVGTGFHPELTGRENVYVNGAILGMSRAEIKRKFDEIVEFAGVEKFLDTPVKRYSSGMQVRLAFAVAAHLEPEILIVDEVLAVGDAEFQRKCLGKMRDVVHVGRTVLFVSHNLSAIQQLCSRSILMNRGCIIFDGEARTTCEQYVAQCRRPPSSEHLGRRSLLDCPRIPPHIPIIASVELRDSTGRLTDAVALGKPLTVSITCHNMQAFPGAQVGVMISNSFGQRLCSSNTALSPETRKPPRTAASRYTLTIPAVYLLAGEYSIELSVAQQGACTLDRIAPAIEFSVIDSDLYGTGYRVPQSFGVFALMGDWALSEEPYCSLGSSAEGQALEDPA